MSAVVRPDATVRLDDPAEATSTYARGYFGTLGADGTLTLDRYEAVYLLEMQRLEVVNGRGRAVPWPALFRASARAEPGFGVRYLVYRDLRQRGYVVRAPAPVTAFAVLPRGGTLHKTPARFWVDAVSERTPFDLRRLFEVADRTIGSKKSLLLGVVDEESDLTYYRVRRTSPSGTLSRSRLSTPTTGWVSEDRVLIFDPTAVESLGRGLAFGSRVGSRLELSLIEAAYLVETGELELKDARSGRGVPFDVFQRRAARIDRRYRERLAAYRHLRERRLVVKTGFKYGAHFRAYPRNPEEAHARYLVHAVPLDHVTTWAEIAAGVRVAQGVRKEFLLAGVSADGVPRFLALERVRP